MATRPRVLCVDDEEYVLDGLQRSLRASFTVTATVDPNEALALLANQHEDAFAVVVSDMHMPQMTGIGVLEAAQRIAPDTTRVLLTGDADIHGAVAAINRGQVYRFMLKPCATDELRQVMTAASEQHRLVQSERELLESTLTGCVDALMETLGMAQPAIFSRAGRLRRLTQQLCARLEIPDAWQIEVAAQMGEIGAITLPPLGIALLERGVAGNAAEAGMLAKLPQMAESVLARIPRLEAVREIVRYQLPTDRNPVTPLHADAPRGAHVLQLVREYDALVWRNVPVRLAVATLTARGVHDTGAVAALAELGGVRESSGAVREIKAAALKIGDELAADLYSARDLLLVARGQVITERLLVRVLNYESSTGLRGKILVLADD